jgi:hypothetical protein
MLSLDCSFLKMSEIALDFQVSRCFQTLTLEVAVNLQAILSLYKLCFDYLELGLNILLFSIAKGRI